MRSEIGGLLARRGSGHAVDIMMAVAFDVPGADERGEDKVLLQADAALCRQILG